MRAQTKSLIFECIPQVYALMIIVERWFFFPGSCMRIYLRVDYYTSIPMERIVSFGIFNKHCNLLSLWRPLKCPNTARGSPLWMQWNPSPNAYRMTDSFQWIKSRLLSEYWPHDLVLSVAQARVSIDQMLMQLSWVRTVSQRPKASSHPQ